MLATEVWERTQKT